MKAVCFDDYQTLRYLYINGGRIEVELAKALKRRIDLNFRFLDCYNLESRKAEKTRKNDMRETSLIEIITSVLKKLGYDTNAMKDMIIDSLVEATDKWKTCYYPDTFEVLGYIKERGYKLGLITNTHWPFPMEVRERYNTFFDVITISYEHGFVKPHPKIFQDTVTLLGVTPSDCIHVGDDPVADIQGAKGAGLSTVFINRNNIRNVVSDYEIAALEELKLIL
jgi:HAD superfamily hydrolase (TIGR01549 family)